MRDLLFHSCAVALVILFIVMLSFESSADLVLFRNGDHRYGKATELKDGSVMLDVNGAIKIFKQIQVKEVFMGIEPPKAGEVISVTGFMLKGGPDIIGVTGSITHRNKIKTIGGKMMTLDVEDGFDINVMQMFPTKYSFFNRRGCFVAGVLINPTTRTWRALQLRAHLYDSKDKMLTSKDFYIFRIPAATAKGPGRRKFELNFTDVAYERIERMRMVRKF